MLAIVNNKRKLRVFPPNATEFTSNGLGVLYDASEVKVRTDLDGTRTLDFQLDYHSESWRLIKHRHIVVCEGQYYRITSFNHKNTGDEICSVTCFHVFADASRKIIPEFAEVNLPVRDILVKAFAGTRFTIMSESAVAKRGMEWVKDVVYLDRTGDISAGDILSDCIDYLEKGELLIDNWSLAVVERVGINKGVRIAETVNSEAVNEESDSSEVVNVAHVYGANSLPLDAKLYPGSIIRSKQSIDLYGECEGVYRFEEIDDQVQLLAEAKKLFAKDNPDRIDMPKSAITITYVDISKMYQEYPSLGVGDTVEVPTSLSIEQYAGARITSIEYYPLSPENTNVTIGNPPRGITDMISAIEQTNRYVKKITDERGKIKTPWLSHIQSTLRTYVNAELKRLQVELHKTGDVWVHPDHPERATALFGGMIALANSKLPDGDWAWKSFITPSEFVGDQMHTAQLNAGVVKIQDEEGYMNIFSSIIEMYRFIDPEDPNSKKVLGLRQGYNKESKKFEFMLCDPSGQAVIWFDGSGQLQVKGQIVVDAIRSRDLYTEQGDIALLTVDKLQTSDFVQRYNNGDTSPVNHIVIEDQWVKWYTSEFNGGETQLTNRYGRKMYYTSDPYASGVKIVNGLRYNDDGSIVSMTDGVTPYPVIVYSYTRSERMSQGFSASGLPQIKMGDFSIESSSVQTDILRRVDSEETGFKLTPDGVKGYNIAPLSSKIRSDSTQPSSVEVRNDDPEDAEVGRTWINTSV